MDARIPITFLISPDSEPGTLSAKISIDDTVCFDGVIDAPRPMEIRVDDGDTTHELTIELYDKQPHHTQIDTSGAIISDHSLIVSDLKVDGLDVVIYKVMTYEHDTNGTSDKTSQTFYGTLGCNGTVRMKFSTPIFAWLLEII